MPRLTFWYEFASTYSYPAEMQIEDKAAAVKVDIVWRPFLLGPIFKAQGWQTSPFNIYTAKGAYMWRDMARICADLDLPFQRPDPFPQNGLMAARLATVGMGQGWGAAFSKAVYGAEFGDGRQIDDLGFLAKLVASSGGKPEEAIEMAQADAIKNALKKTTAEAVDLGLFGAPTFVTEDQEIFWGNDRLDQALGWVTRTS